LDFANPQTGWIFIYESQVTWLTGKDKLTMYKSSEMVERLFCSVCGCQFTFLSRERPVIEGKGRVIDISLGTLDEDILRNDLAIIPWRYGWYLSIVGWMKSRVWTEEDMAQRAPK
jgi:hypothetical protein